MGCHQICFKGMVEAFSPARKETLKEGIFSMRRKSKQVNMQVDTIGFLLLLSFLEYACRIETTTTKNDDSLM